MKRLIALFPGGWRRRYGHEFEALLDDGDLSPRDMLDVLRGALDARLNPQSHLGDGGHAMARPWKRGILSATVALILLPVMVLIESWWTSSSIVRRPGGYPQTGIALVLTPYVISYVVESAIFGATAIALWRLGRLRPLWVLCALIAVRTAESAAIGIFLSWPSNPFSALDWWISPLGYGWLPPTIVTLLAGVALVAILARALRVRVVVAIVVGLVLELTVGASDLSLLSYLRLNGLEELLMFTSPAPQATPTSLGTAIWDPMRLILNVGPVVWALALQQIALRAANPGGVRPLGRASLAFARAYWPPIVALVAVVALARFALPAYLQSDAATNPTHFVPTGTDVQAQYLACLKTYGIDLPPGTNTKTASIPSGPGQRCANIINTYPYHAKGQRLPIPATGHRER